MELTLDLSTVAIAEHAHDGHLDFDQLGRLVFDWEDRPTWACGSRADAGRRREGVGRRWVAE